MCYCTIGMICLIGIGLCTCASAMDIVAHRGESYIAPENTLASVKLAWEKKGADAVEIDIRLTRNHRIVLSHDATTKRTTGTDLTVSEATSDELRKLDAGHLKDKAYTGEPIPFLEEVIETIPPGKRLFVEIKSGVEILPGLKSIIEKSGKASQIVLIGFGLETMAEAKKMMPTVENAWLVGTAKDPESGKWLPNDPKLIETVKEHKLDGLDAHFAGITEDFAKAAKAAGIKLYAWTINDPEEAKRLRGIGVDALTTDRAAWMKEQL